MSIVIYCLYYDWLQVYCISYITCRLTYYMINFTFKNYIILINNVNFKYNNDVYDCDYSLDLWTSIVLRINKNMIQI